jgi:hypothetical protein
MNIKEILEKNGVDAEKITALEKEINTAVGLEFVAKKRYDDKLVELAAAKTDLQTAQDSLATAGAWEQKYNDEVTAHKATRDTVAAEKEAADTDGKVAAALKAAGMNEKVIDKALKL